MKIRHEDEREGRDRGGEMMRTEKPNKGKSNRLQRTPLAFANVGHLLFDLFLDVSIALLDLSIRHAGLG